MKIKLRRVLALIMTVVMVVTTITFTAGNTLKAEGEEPASEPAASEPAKPDPAPAPEPEKKSEPVVEKEEVVVDEPSSDTGEGEEATEGETAAPAEEQAKEEEEMPAQSFSKTAGNGIHVSVSAPEGAFPKGTSMSVSAVGHDRAAGLVKGAVGEVEDANGVDITFYKDGKEIQPKKSIHVSLSNANVEGENFGVYHVSDGGGVNKVAGASSNGGSFSAKSFSIYIVVGQEPEEDIPGTLKLTVRFMSSGDVELRNQDTKIIEANTDKKFVVDYSIPEIDGRTPYLNGSSSGLSIKDGKLVGTIDQDSEKEQQTLTETIYYEAGEAEYTIKYLFEKAGKAGEFEENQTIVLKYNLPTTKKGEIDTLTEAPTAALGSDFGEGECEQQLIKSNTVVTVKYKRAKRYLVYNTNGGDFIPSTEVAYGGTATVTTVTPEKEGYTFAGWFENEGLTTAAKTSYSNFTETKTLYAKWTAKQVLYTVVFQKEVADGASGSHYDIINSTAKKGLVGSTIDTSKDTITFTDSSYYEKATNTSNATVAADGSTVVYVKYNLKKYDIIFDLTHCYNETSYSKPTSSITMGGQKYTTQYTISKVKLGQDVSAKWPTKDNITISGNSNIKFGGWEKSSGSTVFSSKRFEVSKEMLAGASSSSVTYYPVWQANGKYVALHYMLQDTKNTSNYVDSTTYYQEDAYTTGGFSAKELYGFTHISGKDTSKQVEVGSTYSYGKKNTTYKTHYYFYYNRNKHDLVFKNKEDDTIKSYTDIMYQANISQYNFTPTRPSGTPDYYVFKGWYDNAECYGDAITISTMPNKDLFLYAKWAPEKTPVTITYRPENGSNNITETVKAGGVPKSPTVTKAGYVFEKWENIKTGKVYVPGTPIYEDTVVKAIWLEKGRANYTVRYVDEDGDKLFDDETLSGVVGARVKADAKPATQSAIEKYRTGGYYVDEATKSIVVKENASENIIEFVYSKCSEFEYQTVYKCGDKVVSRGALQTTTENTVRVKADPSKYVGYKLVGDSVKTATLGTELTEIVFNLSGEYTITYELNGGSWEGTAGPSTYTFDGLYDNPITIGALKKSGVAFAGWDVSSKDGKVNIEGDAHNPATPTLQHGTYGNLTFTAKWTNIVVSDKTVTYNGKQQTIDAATINDTEHYYGYSKILYKKSGDPDSAYSTTIPTWKDAGNYTINVKAESTQGYKTLTANAKLTISKRTVNLKSETASKPYDGTPLTKPVVQVTGDGFVTGEASDIKATGSVTYISEGEVTNTITYSTGTAFKTKNYTINKDEGKLSIKKGDDNDIVLTANSKSKTYDGAALTDSGYTFTEDILKNGDTLTATVEGSITDAGKTTNTIKDYIVKTSGGKDVTDHYDITTQNGTLTVNKRTLKVTTPDKSKVYDGKALTAAGTCTGFVEGESATFKTTGTQTAVGKSQNTYSLKFDGNAKADNYSVSEKLGWLEVTEYAGDITVTTTGYNGPYDGKEHGATVKVTGLPEGYTLAKAESKAKATHVSAQAVPATCDTLIINNAAGEDVTSKLSIKKVDGTITITPAQLTVTTESATKAYDGTVLTAEGSISGFVGEETATFAVTGSQEEVGESDNTYSLTFNDTAKASDYTVVPSVGKLVVTAEVSPIVVTTTGESSIYDGKEHKATVKVTGLKSGYSVKTAESNATMTHVADGTIDEETGIGSVEANCDTLVIVDAKGKDVTDRFKNKITQIPGTVSIIPKPVQVSTPTAEKTYDGKALTAAGTCTGILDNETYGFKTTGKQTDVGSSDNTYELKFDEALNSYSAKETDYKVTASVGTLKVKEYAGNIKVTTTGGSFKYDGEAHGATVEVTSVPEGYVVEKATSSSTATNVSDNTVTATCDDLVIKRSNKEVVYDLKGGVAKLTGVTFENGSISITPRAVTLTSEGGSKAYDGLPLTKPTVTVTGDEFVSGEVSDLKATGSVTYVDQGTVTNTITYNKEKNYKDGNYTVTKKEGSLSIVANDSDKITITAGSASKTYDGSPLTADNFTYTEGILKTGEVLTATVNGTITNAGTAANKITDYKVMTSGGKDVTSLYKINTVNGELKINEAPLTVETKSAEKTYDGTELTATGSISGFVNGERADFAVTGTRTDVGEADNTYRLKFKDEEGAEDATAIRSNYSVSATVGKLKVNESTDEITVTTVAETFKYDGKEHGATVRVSTLPTGYTLAKAESSARVKDVQDGAKTAKCDTLIIKNAKGVDVTSKLNIKRVEGDISITPRTVILTSESGSKAYDGEPLTKPNVTVTGDGFVAGEVSDIRATGSVTYVAEKKVKNTITYTEEEAFKESNYTITKNEGELFIVKSESDKIVITANSNTKVYDGSALTDSGYTFTTGVLKTGETLTATVEGSVTDAGKVANQVTSFHIVTKDDVDVTDQYAITTVNGELSVTPAPLSVVTQGASKTYDGTKLTAKGSVAGFVGEETAAFAVTGSQTDVGESNNTYTLKFKDESATATAVKSNYTVNETIGKLTVNESDAPIVATTTGGEFTYNGKAHYASVNVTGIPTGYQLVKATSAAAATNVAEGPVAATCDDLVIKRSNGTIVYDKKNDVKLLKNVSFTDGTITVTPDKLTVETGSANKPYDGDPLTCGDYTISSDNGLIKAKTLLGTIVGAFTGSETVSISVKGTQTDVGYSSNTYELDWNGTATESNYTVDSKPGTLTVTENAKDITVTTTGGEFTYDGQAHGATCEVANLPKGYSAVATSSSTATDVTASPVTAVCDNLVITNKSGTDVTDKFAGKITYNNGTIKIKPATLTVTTETATKTYNGTALTAGGSCSSCVNNETVDFAVTGTQTAVGTSNNTYSLKFQGDKDSTATAKKGNYTVQATVGTLTVNEYDGDITVTTTGYNGTYDGAAHGATVAVSELPEGYTLAKAESTASATHVAESGVTATCDQLVIKNAAGEDVTKNLSIKKVDGTITITPRELAVTTESDTKAYDGTELTASGSISGFVNGEDATFEVTGSQTEVGETDNTYTLTFDKKAAESDYTVVPSIGKLKVTDEVSQITVTTTGESSVYDGEEHGATVEVTGLPKGYTLSKAVSYDTITHVNEGTIDPETGIGSIEANCDELIILDASGKDVTNRFKNKITQVPGTISIVPKTVQVSTPTAEKTYDGKELKAAGTCTGILEGETYGFVTKGTQTDVGSSKNIYTLVLRNVVNTYTASRTDYKIVESIGTLTVKEYAGEIKVKTTGGSFTYTGTPHGASVSVLNPPAGYVIKTATSSSTATHVSESPVEAVCDDLVIERSNGTKVYDLNGDVKLLKNVKFENGSIAVTPATLTVNTPSDSKVYDNSPLTKAGTIEGFVNGETATFTTTGTRTEVGTSDNTYSLVFDDTAKETDYTVSETIGKLTVTESEDEIVITTTGGEFPYDGQAHSGTVSVGKLPAGYHVETAESTASVRNVADNEKVATCDKLVIKNGSGKDVTEQLKKNIRFVDGKIKVTPAPLAIVTNSDSKTYDGTALTAPGTCEGLKNGEIVDFAVTGSQIEVGESNNNYSLKFKDDKDKEHATATRSNYTVNATVGKLKVNESTEKITVTTEGGSFTYDGQAHGGTVKVSKLPTGYTLEKAVTKAKVTDVADGSKAVTCDELVIKNAQNKDVTSKLNIEYKDGTIVITPRAVTLTSAGGSKPYDGKPLTIPGVDVSGDGFVTGEVSDIKATGSVTSVSEKKVKNTITYQKEEAYKDDNYSITKNEGDLFIVKSESDKIVITANSSSEVYDGAALTNNGYTFTQGVLKTGETLTATVEGSITNVGDTANKITGFHVRTQTGTDVTDNYAITTVNGTLEVTPATLSVTTGSGEKTYDGTELTAGGEIAGCVGEEEVVFAVTGSQTEVGKSTNTYTVKFKGEAEGATADKKNYEISENLGTLKVNEAGDEITVTVTGGKFTYDGTTHSAKVTVSKLPTGYTLDTATSSATATHVAEGIVTAECNKLVIKNASGKDVTSKLNIKKVPDTIEVTPKTLTVVTPDANKPFDGDPLTAAGTIDGFENGETATFVTTGSQTNKGKSKNTYTLTFDKTAAKTDYTVDETIGELEVTAKSINNKDISVSQPENVPYNGKEQRQPVEVKDGNTVLEKDKDYEITYSEDVTNVGRVTVTIKGINNYSDTRDVYYSITPLDATVTADPASKKYSKADPEFTAKVSGELKDEQGTIKYTVTRPGKGTDEEAGTYNNAIVPKLKAGTEAPRNYSVTYVPADFTIEKVGIDPNGPDHATLISDAPKDTVYDGATHKWTPQVTTPEGTPIDSKHYVLKYYRNGEETTDFTSVGTITVKIIATDEGSYSGEVSREYKITKRPVTITVNSTTKRAGDKDPEFTGTVTNKVDGEDLKVQYIRDPRDKDKEAVGDEVRLTATYDEDVAANYEIKIVSGTMTIQDAGDNPITATGDTIEYDGSEHNNLIHPEAKPGSTFHYSTDGDKFSTDQPTFKDAGSYTVYVYATNPSYKDSAVIPVTIVVKPRAAKIVTDSKSKAYDGKPLTAGGRVERLVAGETVNLKVTGSQTAAGSSDNTYEFAWLTAKESNYSVTEEVGKLTVEKASIDPNKPNYTGIKCDKYGPVKYNGEEQKWIPELKDPSGNVLEEGRDYLVEYKTTDMTNVGEVVVVIKGIGNYSDEITRTYKIIPRDVVLTSPSATKVYDGTELRRDVVTVSGDGFVKGEGFIYQFGTGQVIVGSKANAFTYRLYTDEQEEILEKEEIYVAATPTLPQNYNIRTVFGTLTVTGVQTDDGNTPTNGPVYVQANDVPTQIADDKTPTALKLFGHDCCILHLLIMLAALLLMIWYVRDMKARQRRILELEEELGINGPLE